MNGQNCFSERLLFVSVDRRALLNSRRDVDVGAVRSSRYYMEHSLRVISVGIRLFNVRSIEKSCESLPALNIIFNYSEILGVCD